MIEIKICGITNEKEIEFLNILKPEYIGFVFTKSKRQVTPKIAKKLCLNLNKDIKIVGVFKDNPLDEILDIIAEVPLNVIQLHGKEDENYISLLRSNVNESIKIWKALSINDIENINKYVKITQKHLIDGFLIDGDKPGSGEVFSLDNLKELFIKETYNLGFDTETVNMRDTFFLAGGITPENVVERIIKARPRGIDVSSGVEIIMENGVRTKSFEKMKDLIENVRKIID
ncbi:phosphoribosylanthranilate isomerase [Clostridium sp. BL-8]|uniref:phosphoribosylanthranilate isomerase n=1 Tax=Clostridium sp. BL-8 TaxID=349938 RepID=UPI00098CE444|nr:phosphoribosylanthranilate isomerase [Clostridium sp. BL-8]OOM78003.1 N-(5'-phosphoribosyl)anthranilate isomerase [Clostridium sp. BL-8]